MISTEWKTSITIPIFKRGSKKNPENYRGITLLNSIRKVLTKILSTKIIERVGISEEQQGFYQNRSTVDAIFIIRQLAEKSIEFNKPPYTCFVDLKQAFDRVQLKDVIEILQQYNIINKCLQIISELNRILQPILKPLRV
jgi:hypothetical protein